MHVHVSALDGLIVTLYVIVILGTLNLLAMRFPDNPVLASYGNLFGIR